MPNDELRRRLFLARSGQYLALTVASPFWALGQAPSSRNPFTLGVASGDPVPDGALLWTRLAPDPLQGGGMPRERVAVEWRVASDERMSNVVARGRVTATPDLAHSVHVDVRGLQPGRWYWYQFKTGSHESRIGRTRTAPDPKKPAEKLNFAFASCQHYETGFFTAYKYMAEEELDLVVHLGDYIYEGGVTADRPRPHNGPEPNTLDDYRNRHALYKLDPDLQRVHALFPWIVTWDDHEVDNNYANDVPQDSMPRAQFLEKRANAYQAYYENMPLRRSQLPKGSALTLYRRVAFSDLAEFSVLDTRQYRSDQPCEDGTKVDCALAAAASQTILGPSRSAGFWMGSRGRARDGTSSAIRSPSPQSTARQVRRSPYRWISGMAIRWSATGWCEFIQDRRIVNPVVLTGDVHANWAVDVKLDWKDPKSPIVATEFVGTSITSGGDGADHTAVVDLYLPENPQVHFFNAQRGYVRCQVTPEQWRTDYRVVPYVTKPGAPLQTRASFVVENGRPGAKPA